MTTFVFSDKAEYRIAQLTDCHLLAEIDATYQGIQPGRYLQRVIAILQQQQPDAVIITGDLSQDHTTQSYQLLLQLCQLLTCPVFLLPGNHDDLTQLDRLASLPPFRPERSLLLAGWQLLLLNTKGPTPAGVFPLPEQQWMAQQLANSHADAIWLFCHHHPRDLGCFIDLHGQQHQQALWQQITGDTRIQGIAHGHSHYAYQQCYQQRHIVGCPATSVQFLPVADWQTIDQGPQWCMWHFKADGNVNWQFRNSND